MGRRPYRSQMLQNPAPAAETPEVPPAMASQRAHPRRTAPTGGSFPPTTLRRQNAQVLLPEDFIHGAGRQPVPLANGVQQEDEPNSPPSSTSQARQGILSRVNSSRAQTLPSDHVADSSLGSENGEVNGSSGLTAPDDEDRLIQRNVETFQRRLRASLVAPVSRPSQRARSPRRPLHFQEQPTRQSRRRPRSPSPIARPSRRIRLTSPSADPDSVGYILVPPLPPRRPVSEVAHLIPLRTAPEANPSRPPPPYSPRNPRLHPTSTDYDLTPDSYGHPHNNGAPPLPLYTQFAGHSERVLPFGGSQDEQRNAYVRLCVERFRQQSEERLLEVGLPPWEEIDDNENGRVAAVIKNRVAEWGGEDAEWEAEMMQHFMNPYP